MGLYPWSLIFLLAGWIAWLQSKLAFHIAYGRQKKKLSDKYLDLLIKNGFTEEVRKILMEEIHNGHRF